MGYRESKQRSLLPLRSAKREERKEKLFLLKWNQFQVVVSYLIVESLLFLLLLKEEQKLSRLLEERDFHSFSLL